MLLMPPPAHYYAVLARITMALSSLPHGPFAGLGLRRVAAIVGDLSNERWDCADTVPVAQPASLFEPFVSSVARTMKIFYGNDWVIAYAHIPTCAMRYRARRWLCWGDVEKSRAALISQETVRNSSLGAYATI